MNIKEVYERDMDKLTHEGMDLLNAIQYESLEDEYKKQWLKVLWSEKKYKDFVDKLPSFCDKYQDRYSQALVIIKFLIPDRVNDFIRLYEKPKNRKELSYGNYVIEDYFKKLHRRDYMGKVIVWPDAAIPQFQQQLNILKSCKKRFESSLFNIKQLLQADLFDSELESASELLKKGFVRAAWAIAWVVLEKHLDDTCNNHNVKMTKKNPTINDYNQKLKDTEIIDTPTWRFIQHLGDLRNLCDHNKKEPTKEEIDDLTKWVDKIIKTIF